MRRYDLAPIGATKTCNKNILLSSGCDPKYYCQRTTQTSGLPSSHHRPLFIMRPAICAACARHVAPTLSESPQHSWWGLVLAETHPAHWMTRKVTSRSCLCLGSYGSLIVSCTCTADRQIENWRQGRHACVEGHRTCKLDMVNFAMCSRKWG